MRRFSSAPFVAAVLLAGCGAVPAGTGSDASSSRTASPSALAPSPSGAPDSFQLGDCTYATTSGTPTQPVNDTFQTVISVPAGWTRQDTSQTELPFLITAPSTYQYLPTTISLSAPLPTDPGQSPSTFLARLTQGTSLDHQPLVITASPQSCVVGADSAAFLSFTSGSKVGYMVLWFHFGDAYLLQLVGDGGVDRRAVQDAKAVLASVGYARNVPPPGYTPSPTT